VRQRFGSDMHMQLNYLIMRPSCSLEALEAAWALAERYDMTFRTDLIHYSLPYFTEGPDKILQFMPGDRPNIERFVAELLCLKIKYPRRFVESVVGIRSIPDWLEKGPAMRVPCDARKLIWVGADGTVQLCYVTFKLGNLHEARLKDMLFTAKHRQACRDAFELNCPNCHCERDDRVQKDRATRNLYSIGIT
jgi:sulfatase maturation enzyme AslB (radical SAM superfamily)